MSEHKERELQFGIDRLVTNGKRILRLGLGRASDAGDRGGRRCGSKATAGRSGCPSHFGLARADVERAFPLLRNAGSSGFVVTGYPPRHPARKLILELRLDDGADDRARHHACSGIAPRGPPEVPRARSGSRARPGGGCAAATSAASCSARVAQNYRAPSLDDVDAVGRLLPRLRDGPSVCLVFDHNLGGGANQYRRQLIDERLAGGITVLLCTYNLPTRDYRLQVFRPGGGEEVYRISSFLGLEPILAKAPVAEIFLNSPVSFDEPLVFADWVARCVPRIRGHGSRSPCTTISRCAPPSCC